MSNNTILAEVQKRINLLEQWKREATAILDPILEYGRKDPDIKLGASITDFVIERCKRYDELKAENRVQQAAIELLVEKYKAQKERAECCRNVLQDLVESIPNQTEDADWWPDSLRTAIEKANKYIQDWQNKEGNAKEKITALVHSMAEDVGRDAETAKAYLESEGLDVKKLEDEGKFLNWLAKLYTVTFEKTGQRAKINQDEARKWYDSGATPEQCFRENWQCDGD